MNELLTAALQYATLGWPVLPLYTWRNGACSCGIADCSSPAKHPLRQLAPNGLKNATTNPDTITDWWTRFPTANVGLRTGDAFDVLDVDGEEGEDNIVALCDTNGPLPAGPAAATGGGGQHLLYQPTGIGNRAGIVPKVDWRGRNGYIVAPPSLHASGRRYKWTDPPSTALEPVPEWLRLILDPPKPERPPSAPGAHPAFTSGDGSDYGLSAMDAELAELERAAVGTRNHTLNVCAFNLYQLVAGGELTENAVELRLLDAGLRAGLSELEVRRTMGSAKQAGMAAPRTAPALYVVQTDGNLAVAPAVRNATAFRYTDVGNSLRLVEAHGNDLRWVPQWATWLVWDGQRWARDHVGQAVQRAKDVAAQLVVEAANETDPDKRKAALKAAATSESAGRIEAMLRMASTEPGIPVLPDHLDANPWQLNVAPGTIDLRTGELRPHARQDHITKLANIDYQPDATAPTFEAFLERVVPDPDVRNFLQEAVGYALTGDVSEQVMFFLHGSGANGKSTFLEAIQAMLGEYAKSAEPDLLLARNETHPTGVADLQGARLVVSSEIEEGRRLAEATVKQLTGGDRIKARYMRQDFFEFTPTHKLFIAANHRPIIRGTDHAIWRRIRLVPFEVVIPPEERDRHLGQRLQAELPGILRWAVEGCLRWQQRGLSAPDAVMAATNEYRREMDVLGAFLDDQCVAGNTRWVMAGDLYHAYQQWCGDNGERAQSQRALGLLLSERGFENRKHGPNRRAAWFGIGLRTLDEPLGTLERNGDAAQTSRSQPQEEPLEPLEPFIDLKAPYTHAHEALTGNQGSQGFMGSPHPEAPEQRLPYADD